MPAPDETEAPKAAIAFALQRNKLAHEVNFFSNFHDWNSIFLIVKRRT